MHKPDMIHVALEAAGGRAAVAQHFSLKVETVRNWARNKSIPPEFILPLCHQGADIVKPEQILAYIEQEKKEMK